MGKAANSNRTKNEILGVALIAFGIQTGIAVFSGSGALALEWMHTTVFGVFGVFSYGVPLVLAACGVGMFLTRKTEHKGWRQWLTVLGFVLLLTVIHIGYGDKFPLKAGYFPYIGGAFTTGAAESAGGGALGALLAYPLALLLGTAGSIVILVAGILIIALAVTGFSMRDFLAWVAQRRQADHRARMEFIEEEPVRGQAAHSRKAESVYEEAFEMETKERVRRRLYVDEVCPAEEESAQLSPLDESTIASGLTIEDSRDVPEPERNPLFEEPDAEYSFAGHGLREPEEDAPETEVEETPEEAYTVPTEDEEWAAEPSEIEHDAVYDIQEIRQRPRQGQGGSRIRQRVTGASGPLRSPAPVHIPEEAPEEQVAAHAAPQEMHAECPPAPAQPMVYHLPPVTLLKQAKPAPKGRVNRDAVREKAQLLEECFANFKIDVKVVNVCIGPTVTRYEIKPAPGVKVSKVVNLSSDIALALAAESIRIEAPIPGKAAIGVEVPNDDKTLVNLRSFIDSDEFRKAKSNITFAIGKDIVGKNIFGDLGKMPHLLIGGTTGSGKSICTRTILMSLLFEATPEELQLIIIDPKQVEFLPFNGIPHLRVPVVTDAKKAAGALCWAVTEMVNRYKLFSEHGVREIAGYNAKMEAEGGEKMPKLVVLIDELADLMMVSASEVEDSICRIAQLGRAGGIHLIIATQSPRADVVTGLIKANLPSQICLKVGSQLESRITMNRPGGEKLLGNGDMLYMPTGAPAPTRIQGCFVSDEEVEAVVNFLKEHSGGASYDEALAEEMEKKAEGGGEKEKSGGPQDELLQQAVELVLEYEQASASMLQRRMRVGYNRAARLVDEMEQMGVIGPSEGSKPRQVLITWDDYNNMFGENGYAK